MVPPICRCRENRGTRLRAHAEDCRAQALLFG
ncbi:hypothetical protein F441_08591 [Phytophthora nicotianae CJ01A1]|uniref:Uncharacterized protein n=2 Tax=Phytophthora nicotianae TaxID=4792 RepID=W2X3C0_PHYNI|nr:hypothetical protein L916_08367 [Phytophthora nicotianae]ETP16888.1 hypothetical protein F441_08591 [Phytophthora nicotianae CJ01A1]